MPWGYLESGEILVKGDPYARWSRDQRAESEGVLVVELGGLSLGEPQAMGQ